MQSLTSMHHSPTRVEANVAQRRKDDWLRELGEQVRGREQVRQAEKAAHEIEELKEELRARQMREGADEALRAELARGIGKKGK